MKKILRSNFLFIIATSLILCFIISFVSNEIVLNSNVHNKYLEKKYESKYDEYKNLDIDLAEFEDELSKYESSKEDSGYDLNLFNYDLLAVLGPFFMVLIGFGSTFLILSLFHKSLYVLKYKHLLKTIPIAYLIFYLPEVVSSIYFLIFKTNYEFLEVGNFEKKFYFSALFNKDNTSTFFWNILSETSFLYLIFPFIVAGLLRYLLPNLKTSVLIVNSYLAYLIVFVFYNTTFWYLFDLF